jgi:hypothetical protein
MSIQSSYASNTLRFLLLVCLVLMTSACTGNSSSNDGCPSDEERCEIREGL